MRTNDAIQKRFSELQPELKAVLGEGMCKFLCGRTFELTDRTRTYVEEMFERAMTCNGPQLADEWSEAFETYYRGHSRSIEDYLTFINGSFSMNAPPERRQTAFIAIKGLLSVPVWLK